VRTENSEPNLEGPPNSQPPRTALQVFMSNVDQSLEGIRSVGAVKWVDAGCRRLRGTAALQVAMTNVDQA